MKRLIVFVAAIAVAGVMSGCGAFETVKNYDWSSWWSVHKEPITELAKDAVANQAAENETENQETK